MDRRAAIVLSVVFGGLFVCLFGFLLILFAAVKTSSDGGSDSSSGDKVGIVEVKGAISDSKKILKELKQFSDSEHIKAIVIRIDSPGGAVGPSQEIFDAIKRIRAKKKVVASMGSLAASGGFYIACAADKVYANPGTLTGSIGVIMQSPDVSGVLKWAGVSMNTLTAGKLKDSGSPFRPMSEEERAYFLGVLTDVHAQFIDAVAEGRKLSVDEVKPWADGRIFSGRQAKEAKLVDELGGIEAAVADAAKLGGITGEPKTEYPKGDKKFLRELLGEEDLASQAKDVVQNAFGSSGLQFRTPF
jgi:protease IV